jgi:hypothetical protein
MGTHIGTWILGWSMILYSAVAGMWLALKDEKQVCRK